jgi:phenylacetate-coenzyme A ligase PaaK-like adenylate-forming protein
MRFVRLVRGALWRLRFAGDFGATRAPREFARLDPAARRLRLAGLLFDQVRYFGSRPDALPEWRDAARLTSAEELWRSWHRLPIMTKETLRLGFEPVAIRDRLHIKGVVSASGGSTGEPTRFLHDRRMIRASAAAELYSRLGMGWTPDMPIVAVWGAERDIGRQVALRTRVTHRVLGVHIIDGYQMTADVADRCVDLITRLRPVALYGFTSMVEHIARELLRRGIIPPPGSVRTVWNGGEMLNPEQARLVRQAFGVPFLNLYGGREVGTMACQFAAGEPLEVLRPWVFIEVVDDSGNPVQPGQSGRLLVTSTACRGTPFLRYEVGDLGSYRAEDADESGIHHLSGLTGRIGSVIDLPDGRQVNMLLWNHFFKEFPEVHQFQVRIRDARGLRILLRGTTLSPDRQADLERRLRDFLRSVPVELVWVDRIPLTGQGKLIQVVRE